MSSNAGPSIPYLYSNALSHYADCVSQLHELFRQLPSSTPTALCAAFSTLALRMRAINGRLDGMLGKLPADLPSTPEYMAVPEAATFLQFHDAAHRALRRDIPIALGVLRAADVLRQSVNDFEVELAGIHGHEQLKEHVHALSDDLEQVKVVHDNDRLRVRDFRVAINQHRLAAHMNSQVQAAS